MPSKYILDFKEKRQTIREFAKELFLLTASALIFLVGLSPGDSSMEAVAREWRPTRIAPRPEEIFLHMKRVPFLFFVNLVARRKCNNGPLVGNGIRERATRGDRKVKERR